MAFVCPTCGRPCLNPAETDEGSGCYHEQYEVVVWAIEVEEDKVPLGIRFFGEEEPDGMGCTSCHRVFKDGDRYSEKFEGIAEDGEGIAAIVCLPCAGFER